MSGEEQLKNYAQENFQKTITKVNERIYHFLGYGHSNATAIIGETSVIMVDALDCPEYAEGLKTELTKITDKPVKTLIYTHGHPDHRGGAGAFRDTAEEVIAFAPDRPMMKYYDRLGQVLGQRTVYQFGIGQTDEEAITQGIGIREGRAQGIGKYDFLPPTTVYHSETVKREIDGVKMQLTSAVGESDDQMYLWLEDDRVICSGDNYYGCWPNLYAIRGTQYRDIATWIDSLNEILSYDAVALLPGHTRPILGHARIQEQVGTFRDAIEWVLLRTLDCMNQGMTLDETVQTVKLPEKYSSKSYLGEYYGTVEWSVKSIFTGYLGWFDGAPEHLMPVSEAAYSAALLELIDTEKLKEKIQQCIDREEYQLALQLLTLVDKPEPELKKACLLGRGKQMTSANARHYLIACAKAMSPEK